MKFQPLDLNVCARSVHTNTRAFTQARARARALFLLSLHHVKSDTHTHTQKNEK